MQLRFARLAQMVCLGGIFFGLTAAAQTPLKPLTETPEVESRYPELTTTVDAWLDELVSEGDAVGHSALVWKAGEVVYYGQSGMANAVKKQRVKRDTIFRIYSMSKPITSVAVMRLVEAGKIELDDPVFKYLPSFKSLKVLEKGELVEPKRAMTVRDLLRHTSGLTYGFFGDTTVDRQYRAKGVLTLDRDLEHLVSKLSELPLLHHPGTRFHYSVSTDVLARIVEVVSRQKFAEHLQEAIFDPLGMVDTSFIVPKSKRDRFAEIYRWKKGDLVPAPALGSYRFLNETGFQSGGGGLCSTVDDYLRFSRMLLDEGRVGEHQILKPETLEAMFTNQLESIRHRSKMFQFGLGFRLFPRQGDYSWGGAAGTRFWVNPERDLAILYMVQINPYKGRAGDILRRKVYAALDD